MFKALRIEVGILSVLLALLCVGGTAHAYVWNFTNAADYYTNGYPGEIVVTVAPSGGNAYVAPHEYDPLDPEDVLYGADYASVFARVNTQAVLLGVGDVIGGGFTLSGMNHPDAVYGSLYLSPTGGSGSTVMINLSPMGRIGAGGAYDYTFDLDTAADVKIKDGPGGSWGAAQYTGDFAGAIDWVETSAYSNTYAAFFGPQIGMSGTSGTTFTVTQIDLNAALPPTTTERKSWGQIKNSYR